jgi:RimJ/RimL family protein N-acetyltransferase
LTSPEQRWTDRLHLRRPVEADLAQLAALEREPGSGPVPTAAQADATARGYLATWAADGMGCWVLEHRGRLVGVAGLRFMTFHLRDSWDLHCRVTRACWGRGYALEAVHEALLVAQEHSARLPVVARTPPGSPHAFALAERAGLVRRPDLDRDGLEVHVSHW